MIPDELEKAIIKAKTEDKVSMYIVYYDFDCKHFNVGLEGI